MTHKEIKELAGHREVPPWVMKLVADAVAMEREACADLCATYYDQIYAEYDEAGNELATAIRARGEA